jgi:hypothetical protein
VSGCAILSGGWCENTETFLGSIPFRVRSRVVFASMEKAWNQQHGDRVALGKFREPLERRRHP